MALSFLSTTTAQLEIIADVRPITVMAWAYQYSNGTGSSALVALGGGGGGESVALLRVSSPSGLLQLYDSVTTFDGLAFPLNAWMHVAITWAGTGSTAGAIVAYVNGAVSSSSTSPEIPCDRIHIGNYAAPSSSRSRGPMAGIKVWNAALTLAEIQQEMWSYLPIRTANMYACTPGLIVAEAATNYYGTSWTVGAGITTEDGPPIVFGEEEDEAFFQVAVVGGGVLYTTSIAGGVTPAGSVGKFVLKVLSGGVTPSAAVVSARRAVVSLAASLGISGNVVKRVNKVLSGTITPTGNISKRWGKVLSGTMTPVGALTKRVNKTISGAVGLVGTVSVTRAYAIVLNGALAISGAIAGVFIEGPGYISRGLAMLWRRRRRE